MTYEMLKKTKIALEIKKLLLEINERAHPNKLDIVKFREEQSIREEQLKYLQNDIKPPFSITLDEDKIRYYDQIKFGMLGSLFFLFIMGLTTLISTQELKSSNDFIAYFSKELGICIASGFIATLVPWGNQWSYFIYGFLIPIQVALIIVLLT